MSPACGCAKSRLKDNDAIVAIEYTRKQANAVWGSVTFIAVFLIGIFAVLFSVAPRFGNASKISNTFSGVAYADAPSSAGDLGSGGGVGGGDAGSSCDAGSGSCDGAGSGSGK